MRSANALHGKTLYILTQDLHRHLIEHFFCERWLLGGQVEVQWMGVVGQVWLAVGGQLRVQWKGVKCQLLRGEKQQPHAGGQMQ